MTTLGAVVEASPEKVDPAAQPDAAYIGLEHIESGTKRLCGVGKASDVRSAKSVFRAGDILYGKLRPYLKKIFRPDFSGVCSTDILVLRATAAAEPAFVEYVISTPGFTNFAMANSAGINLPRTSYQKLAEYPILLPPLPEQRRIVARLEALEARSRRARERLAAVPAQLTQARQSLLASAFRGDLTADWRERNPRVEAIETTLRRVKIDASRTGRSASDERISGVAGLSVGNVGPLPPRGWIKLPLLNVARLESGHTPSREHSEYWGGDVPWISIPDARRSHGQTINETATSTNRLGIANSAARILPAGTVCLSRTASVGYVTVMGRPMATSQDFANWLCSEALVPEFLMMAFLAEGEHLLSFGRGSTHTTIYYPELKALYITLPSVSEQHEIVRRLTAAFTKLDAAARAQAAAVDAIDRLDLAVLDRAFSGKLVPQDRNDESASVLLIRIQKERESESAIFEIKPRKTKPAMKTITNEFVKDAIQRLPHDNFSFDDLREAVSGNYDHLSQIVISLLGETKPVMKQSFDRKSKKMHFQRTTQ
jgi:type I restriction enzyme S subunit